MQSSTSAGIEGKGSSLYFSAGYPGRLVANSIVSHSAKESTLFPRSCRHAVHHVLLTRMYLWYLIFQLDRHIRTASAAKCIMSPNDARTRHIILHTFVQTLSRGLISLQ